MAFLIYVPLDKTAIHITDGTGENLLQEDIDTGYDSYCNYTTYRFVGGESDSGFEAHDGGIVTLRSNENHFRMINRVLDCIYGKPVTYVICGSGDDYEI